VRTNEVDRDEQRRTIGGEEARKGADLLPFTTRPSGETLGDTKGRTDADLTMADTSVLRRP
jgi:hypothetical protein